MNTEQQTIDVRDQLEIVDAVADFRPAAQKAGLEFPLLTGREGIVQALISSVGASDTTHVVTNPRTEISGNTAKLYAIVEAQHLPPKNHSRHFLMKNPYEVDLVREGDHWLISNLIINNTWFTGDPNVLIGS